MSVIEDFNHSNAFLQAARNRVHNTLETANVSHEQAEYCLTLVDDLYNDHVQHSEIILAGLKAAIASRHAERTHEYMQTMNRYNRRTVRLSRLFEADMNDYQPIPPEYEYEEDKPPPRPADPDRIVSISRFIDRLEQCKLASQRSRDTISPHGRMVSEIPSAESSTS